jgi:aminopeptidase N
MRSHAVKRIEDVLTARAASSARMTGRWPTPSGPKAYIEINNFYTATVYEKGAEVIGMLKRLVGDDGYTARSTSTSTRHDGQAATIEDWLRCSRTRRAATCPSSSAGTPGRHAPPDGDRALGRHLHPDLHAESVPPTPGQPEKRPQGHPHRRGPAEPQRGRGLPTTVLEMTDRSRPSLRRPCHAARPLDPARLLRPRDPGPRHHPEERAFLLAHDTDPFNKWEAGPALAKDVLAAW